MIRGRIAIPDVDPKTWRGRGKKRKQPVMASAIVTPAPMKKRLKRPVIRLGETADSEAEVSRNDQPRRSAIVEPKRTSVFDDYDSEEHRRAGKKADELFREIVRRAAKRD